MITKNYIITDKGRKNGYTIDGIIREVDHIVCASEYDYYGQVDLYANSYFKDNCRVGVSISGKESVIDNFVKYCIEREYLKEDKKNDYKRKTGLRCWEKGYIYLQREKYYTRHQRGCRCNTRNMVRRLGLRR